MFRYFGSKASSASAVADVVLDGLDIEGVADAFGGLGNIGVEMKRRGCRVTACDILSFPNAFQHSRIVCQQQPDFSRVKYELGLRNLQDVADALNESHRRSLWFEREYAENRRFFTRENARKIGAAWNMIAHWERMGWLTVSERKYVIASFLNSLDSRANTAGTYYAFLKEFDRKALKPFEMDWLSITPGRFAGVAMQGDALSCLQGKKFDLLYLDPPYNGRDYSRYYHLPENLSRLRAVKIDPSSLAGQPLQRAHDGPTIRASMQLPYIRKLIEATTWKRLVVQYAEGAHIAITDLQRALGTYGTVKLHRIAALRYISKTSNREQKHHVFVVDR